MSVELRSTPVQKRAAVRVEAIAAATREAIRTYGRDGFTTGQVAKIGGMSIGVLYRYFPDRVALLEYVYPGGFVTATSAEELAALGRRAAVLGPDDRAWQAETYHGRSRLWVSADGSGDVDLYTDFELVALFGTLRILFAGVTS